MLLRSLDMLILHYDKGKVINIEGGAGPPVLLYCYDIKKYMSPTLIFFQCYCYCDEFKPKRIFL